MKQKHFIQQNLIKTGAMMVMLLSLWMHVSSGLASESSALAPTSDYGHEVATAWFELQLKLVKETPGFSPPVASRAFGYTGITLYEAVVPGMPGYMTLTGQLNDLVALPQPAPNADYHWAAVANSALATITRELFANASPDNLLAVDAVYETFASRFRDELEPEIFNRSVRYGHNVAIVVYGWSMTDGGHEGYMRSFSSGYVPPAGIGLWVSTPRTNGDPQPALQPYWGNNRPFLTASVEMCKPSAPPAYSEDPASAFYAEAVEVYEVAQNLTPEQEIIAMFWADNPVETATPPGHSISILNQLLKHEEATLAFAAEAYAKLGIAVSDSFIGCWNAKYEYNLLRPVTYIQQWIEPDWMPLVNTPPFPEFPSGHSVQSGATAVVLSELFGETYSFTDHTHDEVGFVPRSFDSFVLMAEEAAISRLYGGIHYRAAIESGLEEGRCIGERVISLIFHDSV